MKKLFAGIALYLAASLAVAIVVYAFREIGFIEIFAVSMIMTAISLALWFGITYVIIWCIDIIKG